MNKSVKILDCTLRDGGYVLNWDFKEQIIRSIITVLEKSNIDFIECGYLKEYIYDKNKTFFASIQELEEFAQKDKKYTLMINCEEYDISHFQKCSNRNIKIRVAFKKYQFNEAIEYISNLKKLGWDVFVNPMNTNLYSKQELEDLVYNINKINPYGFFIVDTLGNMNGNDAVKLVEFFDKSLNPNIILGLHTHNSMNLAYENAKNFVNTITQRNLIIDSCLYGMGRGAGNIKTEEIAEYLNQSYSKDYNTDNLNKFIKKELIDIYNQYPWGYSKAYHIAAQHCCHPNYAKELMQQKLSEEKIEEIISKIPQNKRIYFDKNVIEDIN